MNRKIFSQSATMTRCQQAHIISNTIGAIIAATSSGVFYTLLIKQLGLSDALTGILATASNLGCLVQFFTIAFIQHLRSLRTSSVIIATINYIMSAFLYLLPFMPWSSTVRIILFIIISVSGSALGNLISPIRFNWMMSAVPVHHRGIFTARKEITSLVVTIVYNLVMSRVFDYFIAIDRQDIGLLLCSATILVLTVSHMISLLFTQDAPEVLTAAQMEPSLLLALKSCLTSRTLLKLSVVGFGWNFFCFLSVSFHNVFLLQELNCSTTFIMIAATLGNTLRLFISTPFGRYADKHGFDHTLKVGFCCASAAFGLLIFWSPANGQILYLLYKLPYAIALTTLSSALMNVTLQYIPPKDLIGSQGVYCAFNGLASFLGSLVGGQVLARVQASGNSVLGIPVYGQQVLSLISCIALVLLAVYVHKVIEKLPRVDQTKASET